MKPGTADIRAERIHARLRSARWFGIGRYHLERWSIEEGAWPTQAIAVLVISLFEPWLWGWSWADVGLSQGIAQMLVWLAVAIILGNAYLFHRLLNLQTPRDLTVAPWVSVLRTLLASLPLAGMVALPTWGGLIKKRPRWPFRSRAAEYPQLLVPVGGEAEARRPNNWRASQRVRLTQFALLPSFLSGFLALLSLGFGLGRLGVLRSTPPVLAGFAVLHLASYACARVGLRQESAERQMSPRTVAVRHALAACCLLPFPGPLAAFLLRFLERSERTTDGLVWRAFADRSAERRSAGFRTMAEDLAQRRAARGRWRPAFGLPDSAPAPRASLTAERCRTFLRLQAFLLALEAGLLPPLLHELSRRWPAMRPFAGGRETALTLAILGISGLGFATWLALLRKNVRLQNETGRAGRFKDSGFSLGVTCLAVAFGVQAGLYFSGPEDSRRVWALIALICGLAAMFKWLLSMGDLVGGRQERKPWNAAFAGIAVAWLAALVTREALWSQIALRILATVALLSPIWHLLLVRAYGNWLFWPVSWRQLFDPRFPASLRWRLRLVALVAALPFGGLLAPLWPFVRARLVPATTHAWWKIRRPPA